MKRFIGILLAAVALAVVPSCKNSGKVLLPNVSGKAGEIIVVMDKDDWDGDLGSSVRDVLGGDCPWLATPEPMFTLVNVTPSGFADLFKIHRNIFAFNISPDVTDEGVVYRNDKWSRPQTIVQINAKDSESANKIFDEQGKKISDVFEQAERDRIIANSKLYEEASIAVQVKKFTGGGSPHFPDGYNLRKQTDDFMWITDDKQYSIQGVFIYKYPASEVNNFSLESIIEHRNKFMKENVPGQRDSSYMTTSTFIKPTVEFIRFRGRQFAQCRGFWEVVNDYMGGPFVSHSFYSKDNKWIIVLDGWVYAPKYDKRQYLRQVEAIMYSFEWDK
jgi:hypothetical protein